MRGSTAGNQMATYAFGGQRGLDDSLMMRRKFEFVKFPGLEQARRTDMYSAYGRAYSWCRSGPGAKDHRTLFCGACSNRKLFPSYAFCLEVRCGSAVAVHLLYYWGKLK